MKGRFFAALLAIAGAASAQSLPRVHGTALSGRPVTLPDDARGKPAVVLLGFTRDSANQSIGWTSRIASDFPEKSQVRIYSLPILTEVPRVFRSLVVRTLRHNADPAALDTTVPVFDSEAEWKRVISFERPEEIYVVLVDAAGNVQAVFHGEASAHFAAMQTRVKALLEESTGTKAEPPADRSPSRSDRALLTRNINQP